MIHSKKQKDRDKSRKKIVITIIVGYVVAIIMIALPITSIISKVKLQDGYNDLSNKLLIECMGALNYTEVIMKSSVTTPTPTPTQVASSPTPTPTTSVTPVPSANTDSSSTPSTSNKVELNRVTRRMRIYDIELLPEYQHYLYKMCKEYNVDMELALGVMMRENSTFNPKLTHKNKNGTIDTGLMQINSCNVEWLNNAIGITNLFDPYQNIHAGVYILSNLCNNYDYSIHEILISYNAGQGGMRKLKRKGVYTTSYSRNVIKNMKYMSERKMLDMKNFTYIEAKKFMNLEER